MKSWTPLWSSIVDSSVWGESKDVKILWITFLAKKDKDGIVDATVPGMARAAGLTNEECKVAMNVLESPDSLSNNKEFEGRRVQKIQDGWLVLNHHVYRDMIQTVRRREYNAKKQREYRLRKKSAQPLIYDPATISKEKLEGGDIYS